MTVRTTLPLIALTIALQPAHVSAQNTISYETGEYEYAQALPELDDDVVTETIEAAAADQPVGAARSHCSACRGTTCSTTGGRRVLWLAAGRRGASAQIHVGDAA